MMPRLWPKGRADAGTPRDDPAVRLDRKIRLSRLALAWERLWPALWPPLAIVGVLIATALFGLWTVLPGWSHLALLGLALIGFGVSLAPVVRLRWPTREEARARLDADSPTGHRPATGFEDRLPGSPGKATVALWEAHRRRLAREAARLRVHLPSPRLLVRDPFALRAALALVLVVGVFYAGPDWRGRVLELAAPVEGGVDEPLRLDAWVTPPVYTGKAPVFLADGSDALAAVAAPATPIEVPAGSELVLRFHGNRSAEARLTPHYGDTQILAYPGDGEATELKTTVDTDSVLTVDRPGGDSALEWRFSALPDREPEISLAEDITTTRDQTLRLVYSVKDDYGVVGADVRFAHADTGDGDPPAPPSDGRTAPRMEIEPPDFALVLPGVRVREATKEMFRDLTAHPWAGLPVTLTLYARDEAGQEGRSKAVNVTLPERHFINPMARAVIEQRRNLVRRPETFEKVARALNALTISPELFIDDLTVYLSLRTAYLRTLRVSNNEELRDTVDLLWDIALRIEDGDLSLAERELRAAQEALARALAEGASDEEIADLMNELRQALSRFMDALREQASRMGEMPQIDSRMIETHDLSQMLDMIEQLARSGARDAAQQLLSQLQNLLENLDSARMGQMSPEQSLMSELLDELGRMIGEQQRLMDETYRQGQQEGEGGEQAGQMPMPGQRGREGELGEPGGSRDGRNRGQMQGRGDRPGELGPGGGPTDSMSLADQQKALREALEALRDQLSRGGVDSPSPLDRAGRSMGAAEQDLRAGDNNSAVGDQREALDQLRQGAQSMAQQLAEGLSPGAGPGQAGPSAQNGMTDPLGRPMRSTGPEFGLSVRVPDEIDAETARRLREELQRRLGDQFRRPLELDYIERLLELF